MNVYIVEHVLDIYTGLALEQALFHSSKYHQDPSILFWQSSPAVVIGRNQNPWLECNYSSMNKYQVQLARRDSGGGTVYHDEQNVNICIISAAHHDQVQKNLVCFQQVLSKLGVRVELNEKHDLLLNNKKISGSAMRYTKNMLLHHFTVLLSPNTERLKNMLTSPVYSMIQSTAVESRRSEVTSTKLQYQEIVSKCIEELPHMSKTISTEDLHATGREEGQIHLISSWNDFVAKRTWSELYYEERKRLMSEQFLYERTPPFALELRVEHGREQKQKVYHLQYSKGRLEKILLGTDLIFSSLQKGHEDIFMSKNSLLNFHKRIKDARLEEVVEQLHDILYGEKI